MRINRFYWIGLKTQPNSYGSRSGRSGYLPEHTQALRDNIAFDLIKATQPSEQKLLTGEVTEQ